MKILHVCSACCVPLALVFLLGSGEVSTLSARDRSGSEITRSTDSVEQLLSDQKIEDGEAVQRIFELGSAAIPNLIAALQ